MGYAISSKGQVTIPADVRKRLGVKSGDQIEYVVEEGRTYLKPLRTIENPFQKWKGVLRKNTPAGMAVAWVREMRDEDEGQ